MNDRVAADEPGKTGVESGEGLEQRGQFEAEIKVKVTLEYLLYLPAGYKEDESKDWPLLVFLHGAGERGSDLDRVKFHGPPKLASEGKDFPFIVLAPQCPRGSWWHAEPVVQLTKAIAKKYRVDKSRLYLTGLSMGGYGSWDVAKKYPKLFAAIAPVCGGGDPKSAERMVDIPLWVFHGEEDRVVLVDNSTRMVDAIKAAGGQPKLTLYPGVGHDSWTQTYANENLYKWLLEQRRDDAKSADSKSGAKSKEKRKKEKSKDKSKKDRSKLKKEREAKSE